MSGLDTPCRAKDSCGTWSVGRGGVEQFSEVEPSVFDAGGRPSVPEAVLLSSVGVTSGESAFGGRVCCSWIVYSEKVKIYHKMMRTRP